ncbi:hypothetical protein EVAR_85119_1 [Eumeta japonica]|uniref:Uncharacterized protein n=1 Tax=Eumeta variegata TaxID=151549 RepID=A0A4C1XPT9_EUMVA|nr:hypothetical protein EVAR_85119_1 [Eumeta japonica]
MSQKSVVNVNNIKTKTNSRAEHAPFASNSSARVGSPSRSRNGRFVTRYVTRERYKSVTGLMFKIYRARFAAKMREFGQVSLTCGKTHECGNPECANTNLSVRSGRAA